MKNTIIIISSIALVSVVANAQTVYNAQTTGQLHGGSTGSLVPFNAVYGDDGAANWVMGLVDFGMIPYDPACIYTLSWSNVVGGDVSTLSGTGLEVRFYDTNLTTATNGSTVGATGIMGLFSTTRSATGTSSIDVTSAIAAGPYSDVTVRWALPGLPTSANSSADRYFVGNATITATHVPEPSSAVLLGLGALGLLVRRRR